MHKGILEHAHTCSSCANPLMGHLSGVVYRQVYLSLLLFFFFFLADDSTLPSEVNSVNVAVSMFSVFPSLRGVPSGILHIAQVHQ